jgi:hypothetical protein
MAKDFDPGLGPAVSPEARRAASALALHPFRRFDPLWERVNSHSAVESPAATGFSRNACRA